MSEVYLVGRPIGQSFEYAGLEDGTQAFEVLGIFSTREAARKRCNQHDDFLMTLELDNPLPDAPMYDPHQEFPNHMGST